MQHEDTIAFALPRSQLALLKNEKGKIGIEKILKLDLDVHTYAALLNQGYNNFDSSTL